MSRSPRVTLETISRELNISTSSVSRALRNDPLMHPETRAQVNSMATRLGYQGRSRRGPKKAQDKSVVCVIFAGNSLTDMKAYVNMMAYMHGMTAEAEALPLMVSVHAVPQSGGKHAQKFAETLETMKADAVVLCGAHDPAFVASLAASYPIVSLVRYYPDVPHDLVSSDNLAGIMEIVQRLVQFGHRKLAWVGDEEDVYHSHVRRAGFLEGCVSCGLDIRRQELVTGVFEREVLKRPERLMKVMETGVTAVVTSSDHKAYELWKYFTDNGVKIPERLSVTGFDALGEPGKSSPTFTSYDPCFVELGRAAIRLVLWRLSSTSAPPLRLGIAGKLIEGQTIGVVKEKKA